jgi:hypothetical protein
VAGAAAVQSYEQAGATRVLYELTDTEDPDQVVRELDRLAELRG